MRRLLPVILASVLLLGFASASFADDVDGLDCGRIVIDYGDAPEGIPFIGPFGPVIAHYPTCLSPGAPGTQELFCTPLSTPPGPTGYMRNYNTFPSHYWLGCLDRPTIGLTGIDDDIDGKVGPPGGPSACSGGPTDGDVIQAPNSFSQDESYADGDAGLYPNQVLLACSGQSLSYQTANCGNETTARPSRAQPRATLSVAASRAISRSRRPSASARYATGDSHSADHWSRSVRPSGDRLTETQWPTSPGAPTSFRPSR